MQYTINERIKYFYAEYKKMRAIDFAKSIGMSKTVVSNLDNHANKPSFAFIEAIALAYPEINLYWLLLNEGEMLNDPLEQPNITPNKSITIDTSNMIVEKDNTINMLKETIKDKEEIIQLLKEKLKNQ